METRANYILIGLFTLAVVVGAFGFVYWFTNTSGAGLRTTYRVVFQGPKKVCPLYSAWPTNPDQSNRVPR